MLESLRSAMGIAFLGLSAAAGCGGEDETLPAPHRVLKRISGHGGLTLVVEADVVGSGSGGPWGWLRQVLFFVPSQSYLSFSVTADPPGAFHEQGAYLWTSTHLSGDARLDFDASDVEVCAGDEARRLAVGIIDPGQPEPSRWLKIYAHDGRAYPAGEAHFVTCAEALAGMPPLRTWVGDRSSPCEVAAWLALDMPELDCPAATGAEPPPSRP